MKNKGFTLVELLAVIALLGVISTIVVITVNNTLKTSEEDLYQVQIENILTGAKTWASSNVFSLPSNDGEEIILTLAQLKQDGFVEDDITNPKTKELFSDSLQIKITRVDNNYTYEIIE